MVIVIVIVIGLIIGSFLNAVIFRLHTGESFLYGRSHCNNCKHELAALDLIPLLSFLLLHGRCRYCKVKLSWQYPLIELITAISLVLLVLNYGLRITDYGFWFQIVMICFFIVIAVFDLMHYLILDKVVFPALALSFVWSIVNSHFVNSLLGAVTVSGFFLLQYLVSRGKWIGFGDVKLGLLLGSVFYFPQVLVTLLLAYFSGSIVGLTLIALKKKKLSSKLPFGTFLGFSAIITILYGEPVLNWYLRLIGF